MSADGGERGVLPVRRAAPWIAGVLGILVASSALPQGNIDAGKSPAQMFADTCSNCHRRPSELKRGASASFLRQHYTPGAQEAAAMAGYLASVPADPRAGKDKGQGRAAGEGKGQGSAAAATAGRTAPGTPARASQGAAARGQGQATRARQVGAFGGCAAGDPR